MKVQHKVIIGFNSENGKWKHRIQFNNFYVCIDHGNYIEIRLTDRDFELYKNKYMTIWKQDIVAIYAD